MKRDVFPTTRETWIDDRLRAGDDGRRDVNHHLMSVYSEPLQVYFKGSSSRWLGEADDIVHGFFADRLAKGRFLEDWAKSGLRLRRWLMNGFCYYLQELRSRHKRDGRMKEVSADVPTQDDASALDRAFVVSVVREALKRAEAACSAEGLEQHWGAFFEHHYRGRPYSEVAAEMQTDAARAAVMARSGARRFVRALRELLARDGATPQSLEEEINVLLEAAAS